MRRGIGVAHIQRQQQTQQQMADLGAQITAQRVGQIADQLETLEQQLRQLADRHKHEIKEDPVVRARFRQLADSLGVDLISSKKNVFSGVLGLGDFYYSLAGKVVEVCLAERKFNGSYVPLDRVLSGVQKMYDTNNGKPVKISTEDIVTALKKLHCLGAGYNVVELAKVKYVQTTPDGVNGSDEVSVLNFVIARQKEQVAAYKKKSSAAATRSTPAAPAAPPSGGPRIGAAYVLGAHPLAQDTDSELNIPPSAQLVAMTQQQVVDGMVHWPVHRVRAVLQRMVQSGAVWVDYPSSSSPSHHVSGGKKQPATGLTNEKEVWKKSRKGASDDDDGTIYCFMSLTSFAENSE